MNISCSLDVITVLIIGIIVGYLVCRIRYSLAEATAAVLRGTGGAKETKSWWYDSFSGGARDAVLFLLGILLLISGIGSTIAYWVTKDNERMLREGYVFIDPSTSQGQPRSHWVKTSSLKEPASNKAVEDVKP